MVTASIKPGPAESRRLDASVPSQSNSCQLSPHEQERKDRAVEMSRIFRNAGFPARHMNFRAIQADTPWDACAKSITQRLGQGGIIALIGIRGTGKTQMVVEATRLYLAKWDGWTDSPPSPMYARAMSVFIDIRGSYRKDAALTESRVIQHYRKPSLLVLDDMHDRGESAWEDRMLTHIIDLRYGDMKDTILISNQKPEDFAEQVGTSIMSRLTETGGIIVCDWKSFRVVKA